MPYPLPALLCEISLHDFCIAQEKGFCAIGRDPKTTLKFICWDYRSGLFWAKGDYMVTGWGFLMVVFYGVTAEMWRTQRKTMRFYLLVDDEDVVLRCLAGAQNRQREKTVYFATTQDVRFFVFPY